MFLEQLAETVGLFDLRKRNLPGRVWPTETDGRREEMRRWREKEEEVRKRREEGEKEEMRQIENRIKELESSISGEEEEGGGGGGEAALGAASVEGEGEGEKSITSQYTDNSGTKFQG